MIITFLNQKGGVGKTTLAIHTATGLSQRGHRCLLIDADKQGSALDWSSNREHPPLFSIVGFPKSNLHREVEKLRMGYRFVVIDSPPHANDVARSAILASDLVVIPVQPSPYDVWATEETVSLLKEASPFKEKLKSAFVVNRKIVNTAIGRDIVDALAGMELPILDSQICQRVIFAESAANGRTVLELDSKSLASQEINALIDELLDL